MTGRAGDIQSQAAVKPVVRQPPATPLRASLDQPAGVPQALVITGDADVLGLLRQVAGVPTSPTP